MLTTYLKTNHIQLLRNYKLLLSLAMLSFFISCDNDDEGSGPSGPQLTGNSKEYTLVSKSDPAISGTVEFAERDDGVTVIEITLNGVTAGGDHPSHIHANSAAEGGSILVNLTNVDGGTGSSVSEISQLNDGTPVSYNDLINMDGYVNVHLSASDLGTLIAQGDIGENELTGNEQVYPLGPKSNPGIMGSATFAERLSGETLVTLQLEGTTAGGDHPSHIHANTAAEGGGIVVSLSNVDGESGMSATNIFQLNDGTPLTYTELLEFNGYINVHLSDQELSTLIAQGDIGQNALTENSVVYPLNSVSDPAISGTATFAQRNNGNTLITIELEGTMEGGVHPSHIHENDAATGGGIQLSLTSVDGATGVSVTNATMLNDGTPITYEELIEFNGYINVHLSPQALSTLIAQGNIGANAN